MAIYALVSSGGSPGVTATAVALALSWPTPVILAECDPSGGDVIAGLLAGHLPARTGLLTLAMAAERGPEEVAAAIPGQLIALDDSGNRMLLDGLTDPRQAAGLGPAWPVVAAALSMQQADVIADCGRLDPLSAPLPVLTAAVSVTIVIRPTLRQISRTSARSALLSQLLERTRLALAVVGEGDHNPREISRALGLPLLARIPEDERTARLLTDGVGPRGHLAGRPLLRSARLAGNALRQVGVAPQDSDGSADQQLDGAQP